MRGGTRRDGPARRTEGFRGYKRQRVDLNHSPESLSSSHERIAVLRTGTLVKSTAEVETAKELDHDHHGTPGSIAQLPSDDEMASSSGYSSSTSSIDDYKHHGEVYLSPHALAQVERMKRDDPFPDRVKAEEDQQMLFERAASLSPVATKISGRWSMTDTGGDVSTSRWLSGTRSTGDIWTVRDLCMDFSHNAADSRIRSGDKSRVVETDSEFLDLEPPPYRSPSRVSTIGNPPPYRSVTPSQRPEQRPGELPSCLKMPRDRVQAASKFYGRVKEEESQVIDRTVSTSANRSKIPFILQPQLKSEPLSAHKMKASKAQWTQPSPSKPKPNAIPSIGLAVSSAGGLLSCIQSIEKSLADCPTLSAVSVMLNAPKRRVVPLRGERRRKHQTPEAVFRRQLADLGPIASKFVVHASFTSSLGSSDPHARAKSARNLERELDQCRRLGVKILIFHDPDLDAGRKAVAEQLRRILGNVSGVTLAIETMTERCRGEMASFLWGIKTLIDLVGLPGRLKICLDLCHSLQEFDIVQAEGRAGMMAALADVGYENIAAVHISNSFYPHGNHVDRHANLLSGVIPMEAFREILLLPHLRDVPVILETPSYFPDLDSTTSALHAQAADIETQRKYAELEFLATALRCPQTRWERHRDALEGEYLERKAALERSIYRLVFRAGGEGLYKLTRHRQSVRSDEARARAYRRALAAGEGVKEDEGDNDAESQGKWD